MFSEDSFQASMDTSASREIAGWLRAWKNGQAEALDKLIPLVYPELRRLARRHLRKDGGGSLLTTSVVHEAYLRLIDLSDVSWQDRAHFFAVLSRIMRGILVDAARARRAQKRGGMLRRTGSSDGLDLDQIPDLGSGRTEEILAIHEALEHLAEMDPRQARVVEMRFFGGLSVEESAHVLDVSPQTVMRDWRLAKVWLRREMRRGIDGSPR